MISPETLDELLALVVDHLAPRLADELAARLGRDDQERDLTVAQAAAVLGVTAATVRRRAHAGQLPARQEGSQLRFRRADLDAYRDARALPAYMRPVVLSSAGRAHGPAIADDFRQKLRSAS